MIEGSVPPRLLGKPGRMMLGPLRQVIQSLSLKPGRFGLDCRLLHRTASHSRTKDGSLRYSAHPPAAPCSSRSIYVSRRTEVASAPAPHYASNLSPTRPKRKPIFGVGAVFLDG